MTISSEPPKVAGQGEVIKTSVKPTSTAKPAEAERGEGDGDRDNGAPLPLLKASDKASDSDSEQGQRRRSARRVIAKGSKDADGSGGEGSKSAEEGGEQGPAGVAGEGGDVASATGPAEVIAMQRDDSMKEQGENVENGYQQVVQPLAVETSGAGGEGGTTPSVGLVSPGRIMKARKSFPSKKARGVSAGEDDDDDEDSIEEYVELKGEFSDHAESEDAFEVALIPEDEDMSPRETGTVSETTMGESDSQAESGGVSESSTSTTSEKIINKTLSETEKQTIFRASKTSNPSELVGPPAATSSLPEDSAMDTSSVDVNQPLAGHSSDPQSTATARASLTNASLTKERQRIPVIPDRADEQQIQSQAAGEPVVGAAAESQHSLSGSSTPVADFPVGNAGSVIPDSAAFPKGVPVKRSTRQRKPTHFGQHSKRKRNKNISDSDSTDQQSESSSDAAKRKRVRRPNGLDNEDEHSYSLKSRQNPVALTLPDAGDNPKRGLEPPLCCCKMEQERPATVVATTCEALEVVKGNIAVCGNKVESMTVLRPSTRIPYRALCPDHRVKMLEHKCCPGCGCFCSTGSVMSCTMEKISHTFHKECIREIEGTLYCPHCGDDATFAKEVKLPVTPELEKMKTLPGSVLLSYGQIKLPRALLETLTGISGTVLSDTAKNGGKSQEPLAASSSKDSPKARISSKKPREPGSENGEGEQPGQDATEKYTLKNGIVISTASLPPGPTKETLEKSLEFLDPVNPRRQRFHPKNLYLASSQGEVEKVLQMLSEGFDPNYRFPAHNLETPLHGAAAKGHLDLLCLLLQSGANIDAVDANLATPLHAAADNSHIGVVQYLLKCGANINHKDDEGSTVLHLSTKSGNMDMLGYLLTVNKVNLNLQDNGGWTPVIWGADYKNAVSVRYLLEQGADPFVRDKEQNVGLHWAAYSGCQDVMEVFLNNNKDNSDHLNALNVHGDTPLHISARENHYGCAMQLLVRHADVTIKNNENELALDCAKPKSDVYLAIQANIRMKMAIKRRNIRSEVILSRDIAHGLENIPIPVVNSVNNDSVPTDFLYVKDNCETSRLNIDRNIKHMQGCSCSDDCFSEACACSRSSVRCWYDKDGRLMPDFNYQEPPMIFECNRACRCWTNCRNRIVQKGLKKHMQVFRTPSMGWAVRTMQDVPRGSFICEYAGELLSDADADQRQDDSYLFDLDNREGDVYCIDARFYGNVSRFINHRCDPNIVPVRVFIDHQDLRFPRIAFFASRDIRAYEELGFDYGDKFWAIKSKFFVCCCGAASCKHKENKKIQSLLMTAAGQPSTN